MPLMQATLIDDFKSKINDKRRNTSLIIWMFGINEMIKTRKNLKNSLFFYFFFII